MPFNIVRNDITKIIADAVINTANPNPCFVSDTDAAIYTAAGEKELLQARKVIGDIAVGEVVVTPAFKLNAQYIIHTVGPIWDKSDNAFKILESCYLNCLNIAIDYNIKSIAFPLIASGSFSFPTDKAIQIAVNAIDTFLLDFDLDVFLVVLGFF